MYSIKDFHNQTLAQAIKFPFLFNKNYSFFEKDIQKNNYEFLEEMILMNNCQIVSIILNNEKTNNYKCLFLPGFERNNFSKRSIPLYLFFTCNNKMKQLLLSNKYIFEIYFKYYNDYLTIID